MGTEYVRLRSLTSQKPCITLPVMLSLCTHFGVLPTFIPMMEGSPGFWLHVFPIEKESPEAAARNWPRGKSSATTFMSINQRCILLDFCYAAPMPWLADDLPKSNEYLQQGLYTISSYTKLAEDGLPSFTMFSNVPSDFTEAIKFKWQESIRESSHGIPYGLHDHYTIFGLALEGLRSALGYYGVLQGLYVNLGPA